MDLLLAFGLMTLGVTSPEEDDPLLRPPTEEPAPYEVSFPGAVTLGVPRPAREGTRRGKPVPGEIMLTLSGNDENCWMGGREGLGESSMSERRAV